MSIKHFSKPEIIDVAKDILTHDKFIGTYKAEKLSPEDSFREVLDISSLEIAELLVKMEEKYHVHMEWADTGKIDSLNDIYNTFVSAITRTRRTSMTLKIIQNQK